MSRGSIRILGAIAGYVASVAAAATYLVLNDWFGAGDLTGYAVMTLPLAGGVWWILGRERVWGTWPFLVRLVVVTLSGGIAGVLWTAANLLVFGGWFFAYSFPAHLCWIFGAAAGAVVALWVSEPRRIAPPIATAALVVLLTSGFRSAMTPSPRAVVILEPGVTQDEAQPLWRSLFSDSTDRGFPLKAEISGVASGLGNGEPGFRISFWKGVREGQLQARIDSIEASPLVARVRMLNEEEASSIRNSVEW